jgi:fumarylacetoacetase
MADPFAVTITDIPIPDGSPFPLHSLPFGIGRTAGTPWRAWAAVGDHAIDLAQLEHSGVFNGLFPDGALGQDRAWFARPRLNHVLALGRDAGRGVRDRVVELLTGSTSVAELDGAVVPLTALEMTLPVTVGDYVDFYSSLHHATNLGRLFRPDAEPLSPNWRHLPVGYHGRSGTIVATDSVIPRPSGLRLIDGEPVHGPSAALDIELEVGFVVGAGSERGHPVSTSAAEHHLAGVCLVNDWSARDIQAFEYQPLGPFLGKSFATSVSPWLVPFEALESFRVEPPAQDPEPARYLRTDGATGLDLHLEVLVESAAMRADGTPPVVISKVGYADMYWTPAQQLAHLTANGANVRPGDLFASGTVSGPTPGTEGSLIEHTWRGERPIRLPDGSTRTFLHDGDRVVLRGWAGADPATRVGLGEVSGTVVPAAAPDNSTPQSSKGSRCRTT